MSKTKEDILIETVAEGLAETVDAIQNIPNAKFPELQKVEVTNFPEQKAPIVNIPAPIVNVPKATIHVSPPDVRVEKTEVKFPDIQKVEVINKDVPRFDLPEFDEIQVSYPSQISEIYTYLYKSATVCKITVNYADQGKDVLKSIKKEYYG